MALRLFWFFLIHFLTGTRSRQHNTQAVYHHNIHKYLTTSAVTACFLRRRRRVVRGAISCVVYHFCNHIRFGRRPIRVGRGA